MMNDSETAAAPPMGKQLAEEFKSKQVEKTLALTKSVTPTVTTGQSMEIVLGQWNATMAMCRELISCGFLPEHIKSPADAAAIILTGRELGVPPMAALRHVYVIKGKPACDSSLLASMIFRAHGPDAIRVVEFGHERSVIDAKRRGQDTPTRYTFTIEDAERAGLTTGTNAHSYRKWPRNMLHARNVTNIAHTMFPDCTGGLYTVEEMGAPVKVGADGDIVIDAEAVVIDEQPSRSNKAAPVTPEQVLSDLAAQEPKEDDAKPAPSEPAKDPLAFIVSAGQVVKGTIARIAPEGRWKDAGKGRKRKWFVAEDYPGVYWSTESNPNSRDASKRWAVGNICQWKVLPNEDGGPDKWTSEAKGRVYYWCRVEKVRPATDDSDGGDDGGGGLDAGVFALDAGEENGETAAETTKMLEAEIVKAGTKGMKAIIEDGILNDLAATAQTSLPEMPNPAALLMWVRKATLGFDRETGEVFPPQSPPAEPDDIAAYQEAILNIATIVRF